MSSSSADETSATLHDIFSNMIHSLLPSHATLDKNSEIDKETTARLMLGPKCNFQHHPENDNPFSYDTNY